MLLIYLFIIWHVHALPRYQYNMHHTDQYQNGYCLYYDTADPYLPNYLKYDSLIFEADQRYVTKPFHLIPYCLRMPEQSSRIGQFDPNKIPHQRLTFAELQDMNISSEMLLSWSAPVDLVERYDMFLNKISDSLFVTENERSFYNCSSEWFGPSCRFRLSLDARFDYPLSVIVRNRMKARRAPLGASEITCYEHLNCERSVPYCLDWREICDGTIDCLDESDEVHCWQMEINACASNEYRCHNGQCVPREFFHDDPLNPDCLDLTDEAPLRMYPKYCDKNDPTFRCFEGTCPPGNEEFSCSDGQCVGMLQKCVNNRDNVTLNGLSYLDTMACLMKDKNTIDPMRGCEEFLTYAPSLEPYFPSFFQYPFRPVLFDHVRFIYSNKIRVGNFDDIPLPTYICYDEKLCGRIFPVQLRYENFTCSHLNQFGFTENDSFSTLRILIKSMKEQFVKCPPLFKKQHYCNGPTMYQCRHSNKCISKHRLLDGYFDCPFDDDETYDASCSLNDINYRLKCRVGHTEKCFAPLAIRNGQYDCDSGEDENLKNLFTINRMSVTFALVCDGYDDILPVLIDRKAVTDESDCDDWPCNNTYTRCDGVWSCKNGADEIHCLPSDCPLFHHQCIFPNDTSNVSCLTINRTGDGIIDCIGGTDELEQQSGPGLISIHHTIWNKFQCWNDTERIDFKNACDGQPDCLFLDDEIFCANSSIYNSPSFALPKTTHFLYQLSHQNDRLENVDYFRLKNMPIHSMQVTNENKSTTTRSAEFLQSDVSTIEHVHTEERWCHLGLPVYIRNNENDVEMLCLCPPSYYGNECEYQSERVSLTVQIEFSSDWKSLFIFLVTLIDHERNVQSYDHITYSPTVDCDTKFNIYLLYPDRRKNLSKNYSVQIDSFNKTSFNYRSSWSYPIQYPFLPVYRLSVLLKVPISDARTDARCVPSCIHGQCVNYINSPNVTFCRCYSSWSGIRCDIAHTCHCAPNSLCLSNSICICPIDRYGPRCYLHYSACYSNACKNGGLCTSSDLRLRSSYIPVFKCICPFGYTGRHCEVREGQNRIEISFSHEFEIPSTLLVHLVSVAKNLLVSRVSLMKKIPVDKDVLSFSTTIAFNMAFAQISEDYYLIILREESIISATVSTRIDPSVRCLSIHHLFNTSIANADFLIRIKFYQVPCHERRELVCFSDAHQICLCDLSRDVNCFTFNHNLTYNCRDNNFCQNEGQCLLDKPQCPTSSFCACRPCYYGSHCQFSTTGFTLSLDTILGAHIRQNTSIAEQTTIVKYSIVFSVIMFVFALVNSLLTYLTFNLENTRDVGCGLYLYVSSMTSLITISILTMKFWLLLLAQMGSIDHRSLMRGQCISLDFLVRVFLSTNDWLSSCVSMDRAFNAYQGVNFNKGKSKRIAKWLIPCVLILTISTHIHDLIHRDLVDDEEEKRTWCVTQYSSIPQIVDWIVNMIHIILPFLINVFSALLIVKSVAKYRLKIQKKRTYAQILIEQLQQHKGLLISSFILFLLAIPRLIISFLSGCMKSPRNPWLYLIGYFISFIPSLLTFFVFILPSQLYREQLQKSITRVYHRTQ